MRLMSIPASPFAALRRLAQELTPWTSAPMPLMPDSHPVWRAGQLESGPWASLLTDLEDLSWLAQDRVAARDFGQLWCLPGGGMDHSHAPTVDTFADHTGAARPRPANGSGAPCS